MYLEKLNHVRNLQNQLYYITKKEELPNYLPVTRHFSEDMKHALAYYVYNVSK